MRRLADIYGRLARGVTLNYWSVDRTLTGILADQSGASNKASQGGREEITNIKFCRAHSNGHTPTHHIMSTDVIAPSQLMASTCLTCECPCAPTDFYFFQQPEQCDDCFRNNHSCREIQAARVRHTCHKCSNLFDPAYIDDDTCTDCIVEMFDDAQDSSSEQDWNRDKPVEFCYKCFNDNDIDQDEPNHVCPHTTTVTVSCVECLITDHVVLSHGIDEMIYTHICQSCVDMKKQQEIKRNEFEARLRAQIQQESIEKRLSTIKPKPRKRKVIKSKSFEPIPAIVVKE